MLQTVHRTRLRYRCSAVAEPRRARLADRVATLVELRRERPELAVPLFAPAWCRSQAHRARLNQQTDLCIRWRGGRS